MHPAPIEARIALRYQTLSVLPVLSCVCRYAHTQPMLDLLLAPESFLLSERYASAVKTLGLAIFFMPVLPLGCVIALVGLSHGLLRHLQLLLCKQISQHYSALSSLPCFPNDKRCCTSVMSTPYPSSSAILWFAPCSYSQTCLIAAVCWAVSLL